MTKAYRVVNAATAVTIQKFDLLRDARDFARMAAAFGNHVAVTNRTGHVDYSF